MTRIAVFYLARLAEGFDKFDNFARSYRERAAGVDHDLIIIAKGFTRKTEFALLEAIFEGIPHKVTVVADDIGQDIQAYKKAAPRFKHEYACFLNTFTLLQADDWLKKLFDAILLPNVGMVGATGSFESIYNSIEVINRANWFAKSNVRFDRDMVRALEWMMPEFHLPTWQAYKSKYRRFRRAIGDIHYRRPTISSLMRTQEVQWSEGIASNPGLNWVNDFPYFPNPHIRSNAFMLRRADFVKAPIRPGAGKSSCMVFESGFEGLSIRFLEQHRRLLVVGTNGQSYDVDKWPESGCFRSADQSNLLATDNQTASFERMKPEDRSTHEIFSWGSYLPKVKRILSCRSHSTRLGRFLILQNGADPQVQNASFQSFCLRGTGSHLCWMPSRRS